MNLTTEEVSVKSGYLAVALWNILIFWSRFRILKLAE